MNRPKFFNVSLIIRVLFVVVLFFPIVLQAQSPGKRDINQASGFNKTDHPVKSNVRLNEINILAFRHFRKNNPTVEQEFWDKTQHGLTVRYKNQDKFSVSYYDNYGAFLYSVMYFEESDLNNELQKRLKREYPGYQFDILSEINNEIKTIYLVTLKNKYSMKSLLIEQGEIRVIDDLNYAGL